MQSEKYSSKCFCLLAIVYLRKFPVMLLYGYLVLNLNSRPGTGIFSILHPAVGQMDLQKNPYRVYKSEEGNFWHDVDLYNDFLIIRCIFLENGKASSALNEKIIKSYLGVKGDFLTALGGLLPAPIWTCLTCLVIPALNASTTEGQNFLGYPRKGLLFSVMVPALELPLQGDQSLSLCHCLLPAGPDYLFHLVYPQ